MELVENSIFNIKSCLVVWTLTSDSLGIKSHSYSLLAVRAWEIYFNFPAESGKQLPYTVSKYLILSVSVIAYSAWVG